MNEKISNLSQLAYVRRYILSDGSEAGLKIVEVNNGILRFLLNESKALDMPQLWHEGTNISFVSKNGLTVRELPFIRRFEGGMLYTCGIDSVGGREGYELHGSLHNTPACITRCECTEEKIIVQAVIRDSALFGKNLVLHRTVTTSIGSDTVELTDELCNEGYRDEEYCLLYHVNIGYPMLDEGCTIEADMLSTTPRTPYAAQKKSEIKAITAPIPNQEEMCYFLNLKEPKLSLHNPRLDKIFTLSYSNDTLPHFVEWKSMASGDYALGLEPCTTELDDRFAYRILKPQSSVVFGITLKIEST